MHARFDFTLEACADYEGLNSHGDLPQCSPNDFVLEGDLSGERVLFNPPKELAEQMARHFEACRRTSPTSTMVVFVIPSPLSSTRLLDTGKFANCSVPGHICYLNSLWTTLLSRRSLPPLLGEFNCSYSTLIVRFKIQLRLDIRSTPIFTCTTRRSYVFNRFAATISYG
jgi:hypothetical protein